MSFNKYPTQITEYTPVGYSIEIAGGTTGTQGFIDHRSPFWFIENGDTYTSKAQTLAKTKGNLRYDQLMINLSENMTILRVVDYETNAVYNTNGTTFSFNVWFERESSIYTYAENGDLITDPVDALELIVEKTLASEYPRSTIIYDPTLSGEPEFARNTGALEQLIVDELDDITVAVTTIQEA